MENKNGNIVCVFACIVMLVAYFFLPLFSFDGFGKEFSTSMANALISGAEGRLWLFLLLVAPVYVIADACRDKIPVPAKVFSLPNSLAVMLPLICIVVMGCHLGGGSPVSEGEDGGRVINLFAIGDHTGLGYYVYLAAAVLAVATGMPDGRGRLGTADQKGVVIALMAAALYMVMNSQLALFCMDRHTVFDFDEYGRLTLDGMTKGYGWIVYLLLAYMALSAFRHKATLSGAGKFLITPRITAVVITLAAAAAVVLCFGFASTGDAEKGPASISFFLISLGLIVISFRNFVASSPEQASDASVNVQENSEKALTAFRETMRKTQSKIAPLIKKCSSWMFANSKKLSVGACALAVLCALAWGMSLLLRNTTGPGGTTALMELKIPAWTEFVNPTNNDGVRLYRTADADGAYLCCAMEDVEGDYGSSQLLWSDEEAKEGFITEVYTINNYYVCPVIGEEGDFYKIILNSMDSGETECYIRKKECRVVHPVTITQAILDKVEKMYMCRYRIVESGSLERLVLNATFAEYDEPVLYIGELCDKCIVYVKNDVSLEIVGSDEDAPYSFETANEGYKLYYGKSYAHEQESGGFMFDVRKLTDDQIKEIYKALLPTVPQVGKVEYYIPDVDENRLMEFYY